MIALAPGEEINDAGLLILVVWGNCCELPRIFAWENWWGCVNPVHEIKVN